jgi:hypothetical protein
LPAVSPPHEFGNDEKFDESGLTATAPTTGKPCDLAKPSTGPRSIGVSGASVDGFRPLPVRRLVAGQSGGGLTASLGAFAALYGSGRPYRNRARLLGLVVLGLVLSVVAGVEAATVPSPWLSVAVAALIATLASFFCSALNVAPPGAYMFMLACAAGTSMYGQGPHLAQIAMLVAAGGIVSWTLHMLGALWQPRGPERQAVANAAVAVADFIDSGERGPSDLPRHKAATSLHDAWRALIVWQPARGRSDVRLGQLQACSRELHGLFAAAVREASAGSSLDPKASAEARNIRFRQAELPSEDALAGPNERRAFFEPAEMIATSFDWSGQSTRIAMRVGAAALIAGLSEYGRVLNAPIGPQQPPC